MLDKYCEAREGWVLTPDVCLMNYSKSSGEWKPSAKNLKERNLVTSGWTYAKTADGYKVLPTEYVWKGDERYIYIYQSVHDIPTRNEDIPRPDRNCPPVMLREDKENI